MAIVCHQYRSRPEVASASERTISPYILYFAKDIVDPSSEAATKVQTI
jgi:hypothetical protein